MSTPSAVRSSPLRSRPQNRPPAYNAAARFRFKDRNLKRLHLNAVKEQNQDSNNKEGKNKENENAQHPTLNSTMSDRKKHQSTLHHRYQHHHQILNHHIQDSTQQHEQ
ncbi:hypothetical protein N7G274_003557 [Stereocaulon virgatum]|uniref:Uncharacterized protein n=1 Tax=Stereocaulon virgatum TaxID=373712 RepID=A0ABR4AEW4_9LECA